MFRAAAVSRSILVSASAAYPVALSTNSLAFPQRTALVWILGGNGGYIGHRPVYGGRLLQERARKSPM